MFSDFVQIGAVVEDIDRTVQALSDIFGIGPFRVIMWPPKDRDDIHREYYGEPASFTARMAFAELGAIELELIQPISGGSIWSDFLKEHGEGIHHIRFNVSNTKPVIAYLSDHGIGVSQSGSGLRPGTHWANLTTRDKVGFTIEIMNALPGTDGRTPQIIDGKVQA
jgi:hypothetical protein